MENDSGAKSCFVIMPISDPPGYDNGHFAAVYDHLIKPACELAGFKPMRADEVHETNYIIKDVLEHLQNADMAVCDISSRNPNVLYELGIRHAIQKPVTIIKDDKTEKIFDIDAIRFFSYADSLQIHKIKPAIESISKAIKETYEKRDSSHNSPMSLIGGHDHANKQADGASTADEVPDGHEVKWIRGNVDHWDTQSGFGFVKDLDGESFYFNPDFMCYSKSPEVGQIAFFLPREPLEAGRRRVATCVLFFDSVVTGEVVFTNTRGGYGFVLISDRSRNSQQLFIHLNSFVTTPKEGDTVTVLVRKNNLGPVGISPEEADRHEDDLEEDVAPV